MPTKSRAKRRFVVCVRNTGYPASLEVRKIYTSLPDHTAEAHGMLRVVDESGEDYLYPAKLFLQIELPQAIEKALLTAA